GFHSMASLHEKMAVVAPIPNAIVRIAVAAYPGDLPSVRAPKRTSFHRLMESNTQTPVSSIQLFRYFFSLFVAVEARAAPASSTRSRSTLSSRYPHARHAVAPAGGNCRDCGGRRLYLLQEQGQRLWSWPAKARAPFQPTERHRPGLG